MPDSEDKWVEDKYVQKDNVFHRKTIEVRNQRAWNLNESEALELLRAPGAQQSLFAPRAQEKQELSDEEVDRRAFFDDQTPTYNFRYMLRAFRREITRARRYKRPLSIAVVIVDGLLDMLNQHGVLALESALLQTSEALIRSCRQDVDMVGRYGDDRFLLILPETPGDGAMVLAERIRKKVSGMTVSHQWHKIPLGVSMGIAHFPSHGDDIEELIARADVAAEIVQEAGGNGASFAPDETV
jgi:diguanylate cyclase (GGDEF)-like protein